MAYYFKNPFIETWNTSTGSNTGTIIEKNNVANKIPQIRENLQGMSITNHTTIVVYSKCSSKGTSSASDISQRKMTFIYILSLFYMKNLLIELPSLKKASGGCKSSNEQSHGVPAPQQGCSCSSLSQWVFPDRMVSFLSLSCMGSNTGTMLQKNMVGKHLFSNQRRQSTTDHLLGTLPDLTPSHIR